MPVPKCKKKNALNPEVCSRLFCCTSENEATLLTQLFQFEAFCLLRFLRYPELFGQHCAYVCVCVCFCIMQMFQRARSNDVDSNTIILMTLTQTLASPLQFCMKFGHSRLFVASFSNVTRALLTFEFVCTCSDFADFSTSIFFRLEYQQVFFDFFRGLGTLFFLLLRFLTQPGLV